jgi:hypothetical protein
VSVTSIVTRSAKSMQLLVGRRRCRAQVRSIDRLADSRRAAWPVDPNLDGWPTPEGIAIDHAMGESARRTLPVVVRHNVMARVAVGARPPSHGGATENRTGSARIWAASSRSASRAARVVTARQFGSDRTSIIGRPAANQAFSISVSFGG